MTIILCPPRLREQAKVDPMGVRANDQYLLQMMKKILALMLVSSFLFPLS